MDDLQIDIHFCGHGTIGAQVAITPQNAAPYQAATK